MQAPFQPSRATVRERRARRLDALALGMVFASLLALAIHKIIAYDLWWQLETARWILEHGLPRTDPYSYGFPGRAWVELRWLYYLLIHGVSQALGLNGLILLKAVLLLGTFGLLAAALRAPARWIAPLALLPLLLLSASRFRVRPELMSFLWIAVVLLCLERYKQGGGRRWLVPLPLVEVLWCNTHTLWVLGPVLVGSAALCESLQGRLRGSVALLAGDPQPIRGERLRDLALVAAALLLCGFLTPYLLEGALYPITLLQQIQAGSDMSRMITELHSPLYYAGASFWFTTWAATAALSGLSFWLRPERFVLTRFVWWLGFLYLSILSQRNISLFGIVAAVALAGNLRDWAGTPGAAPGRLRRWAPGAARAAVVLGCGALGVAAVTDWFWRAQGMDQSFGFGVVERRVPIRALAFVEQQGLPRPVIADMASGGYLLYRGRERSVYTDGRLEVYGEENLQRAFENLQDGEALARTARSHGVRTAILRHADLPATLQALEARPDWVAVYFDEAFVVFVLRDDETRRQVDALRIDWRRTEPPEVTPPAFDSPPDWLAGIPPRVPDVTRPRNLGYLLIQMDALERSRDLFAEVLRRRPGDEQARLHLGVLEHALGRPERARRELDRVEPALLGSRRVLALRTHLALRRGNPREALDFLERAVAAPGSDDELRQLAGLALRLGRTGLAQTLLQRAAGDGRKRP